MKRIFVSLSVMILVVLSYGMAVATQLTDVTVVNTSSNPVPVNITNTPIPVTTEAQKTSTLLETRQTSDFAAGFDTSTCSGLRVDIHNHDLSNTLNLSINNVFVSIVGHPMVTILSAPIAPNSFASYVISFPPPHIQFHATDSVFYDLGIYCR